MNQQLFLRFGILFLMWQFSLSSISAQSICKGKVVQDDAQGISGCSVSFRDGRRVLAFSYTQDDGHFQLTIPANFDTLTLRVSSLGYTTYQSTRAVGEFTQSELIRLAFDVQRLQEVLITDLSPIVQHNDTTKYKVEAFRDSTERTAEDLLKKLPGIRVSPNGQIQFNNKSVQTVLLNGENMVGSSYTLITRTLAARSIAEIQVIGHYAENPILKMMEGSDAYAVNLVTHEGLKFSGTAQLTGGIPEKYDVGENSILLRNNVRWLNNTHWGNSKLKLSVDPDLGAADPNEANLRYQSGAEQNYLSDFEAQTTEQKHLSHSDVFGITLSANWKINANLLYNQSRLNRDETSETTYNLLQQDFSLVETNKQALSNNQLRGELSSTYCDYRANWFRVNIRQQQVAVRNALSYQNADNLFPSLSKTTALQSLVTAQWTRKLSDLVFSNLELVAILPQSDTEKTALAYQPILNLPEKLVDMRQNKQHHENLFLLKEVVGIRLGNLRFLTELNYTTGKVAAESELHFLTNDHTSWNRTAATQYNNLKLAQAITYNTDKLDVQAKAGGQVANYHDNFLGTNAQPVRQWQPVIQVDVVRKFKRRNAISLSYSNVPSEMLFNNLYPEVQLDSYRSVYTTEGSSREQAQNQRLALDIHLPFLGSYSHFSVGLSQNWLSGQLTPNLDISPESQTLSYVGVHTDRFGALNIEAEKFVASISTLFRLTANYSKMETQMRVNGEQIDKDARVLALGFTLNTAFRGWPNITSTYAYNMYKTPNIADEGKYQSWESNIVLGYRWASVMYLKLEHLHTANVVQHKVSYSSVLNFSAQTESHRSFSVRVSVLNILDTRNFEIVYQDAYVHTRNNRLLCPRSYLLTFEYSF